MYYNILKQYITRSGFMFILVHNSKSDNAITFETDDTPRARALLAYIEEIIKKTPTMKALFLPDITSQKGLDISSHVKVISSEIQFI